MEIKYSMSSIRIPQFGSRKPGVFYNPRPGAYGVLFGPAGYVAVIRAPGGSHLPGGGSEPGEHLEQTLERETLEECGLIASELSRIGEAWEYVYAANEDRYYCKQGSFFRGSVRESAGQGQESDHQLVWLLPEDALNCLSYCSQRWALQKALRDA
jgi:8-oxo-dGTP pyrophosphatase MutT (NUDIX family)